MPSTLICDEDLARRLPLPLAQLYRRAHNAKNPLDRHQSAYYLWEAALKLLGSVAIVSYANHSPRNPKVDQLLEALARPALGHWWEFTRTLVPILADAGDPGFAAVRDWLLGPSRADLPRSAGLAAALEETLHERASARSTVRIFELFEQLIAYRNREIGHGASGLSPASFYDHMGTALLASLAELLDRFDWLAGRRLIYVAEVRRQKSGQWLAERYELAGESARRIEPLELAEDQAEAVPNPELVYALGPGDANTLASLHPLVLYNPETSEVAFLTAKRGQTRAEYLCYSTGSVLPHQKLDAEHRELLARILKIAVSDSQAERWSAQSQAEEPPTPADEPVRAMLRLGDYELLSELGRGGMGVVYRARQPSLGRQVALKCLLRPGDAKAEARFTREIHALGKAEHPNLVKVFTSGAQAEHWFYTMELVEGATMAAVCDTLTQRSPSASAIDLATWHDSVRAAHERSRQEEKPLSHLDQGDTSAASAHIPRPPSPPRQGYVERVVELVRQAAEAAHALHEAGVVHRDIKPGNILVTADGSQAVLMDLGLAQMADETAGRLTRTRQFVGTLRYASPEQVLAVAPVDRRSDVYGLGATLWELLTLQPLFGATEQTPTPQLMQRIQHEEPERPRKYHPGIAVDLETIVLKCLEKTPERRYATAAELAADLDRWLKGELVQAQPPTFLYVAGKLARRHRGALATTASLLFLALAGTAFAFYRIDLARRAAMTQKHRADDERNHALAAEKQAQTEAAISRAVADFLQNDLLGQADPEQNERAKKVTVEELLDRASQRVAGKFADQPLTEAAIRRTIGRTYLSLGLYSAAEPHLARSLELFRQVSGPLDSKTLASENELAWLYKTQGRYSEAESIYKRVWETRRRVLGSDHPDTLTSENNLAVLYQSHGRYTDAEPLAKRVWEARRRVLGPDHRSTLNSENNLALLYKSQGRYTEAEPLYKRVWETERRVLGPDHRNTLNSENNLALLYRVQGRYAEAEPLYKRVLEAQVRVLGADHPDTLTSENNLAYLYESQGRYTDAEPLSKRVWEARRRVLGPDHPSTLISEGNLASLYQSQGRYAEAEPLLRHSLAAWRKRLKQDDPRIDWLLASVGLALVHEGKFPEAEPILRECLELRQKRIPGQWQRFSAEALLGASLAGQKKFAEAEPLLIEGYQGMKDREKEIPAAGRKRLPETLKHIIELYEAWKKTEKAAEWKQRMTDE